MARTNDGQLVADLALISDVQEQLGGGAEPIDARMRATQVAARYNPVESDKYDTESHKERRKIVTTFRQNLSFVLRGENSSKSSDDDDGLDSFADDSVSSPKRSDEDNREEWPP